MFVAMQALMVAVNVVLRASTCSPALLVVRLAGSVTMVGVWGGSGALEPLGVR